jgi:hypothetical protein
MAIEIDLKELLFYIFIAVVVLGLMAGVVYMNNKPNNWKPDRVCQSLEGYMIYDYYNVEGYDNDVLEITFYPELLNYMNATMQRFNISSNPDYLAGWAVTWTPDEDMINCEVRLRICESDNSNLCNDGYVAPITVDKETYLTWYADLTGIQSKGGKQ